MKIPSVSPCFSQRQLAAPSIVMCVRSLASIQFGKLRELKRSAESSSNVERSLLRGRRYREFGSVSLSQHENERILSECERRNSVVLLCMKQINSLNHTDWSDLERKSGRIKLNQKTVDFLKNRIYQANRAKDGVCIWIESDDLD